MRAMRIGWAALAGVVIAVSGAGLPGTAHAAADDPPLVAAAEAGDEGAVRRLLAAGADVDAASVDGATALHWAVHRELPELVRLLVDAGGDASVSNRYGVQPIALAATNGSAVVLEQLLDAGAGSERAGRRRARRTDSDGPRRADLDARTVEGWTPFAIANGLSYSDFFKAQAHTADRLRELMAARGLSTEGHVVDPLVCLDCYLAASVGYDRKDP